MPNGQADDGDAAAQLAITDLQQTVPPHVSAAAIGQKRPLRQDRNGRVLPRRQCHSGCYLVYRSV